jgi:spore coat polysaccharide biosynthesis protein SpsF
MKNAILITVRTDSSRLKNKALLKILGKPTIELVILRAKLVKNSDEIILCTTERPLDDEIVGIAEKCGINYFRGNLEDKLERWLGATQKFNIDYFVTMDGDDLFCDPELIELSIKQMQATNCDFIRAPKGLICGSFTYCIKTLALEKVCRIKDTSDTEMMWTYFEDTGLFNVLDLNIKNKIFFDENIRLTLDYPEDYEFFSKVFNSLKCENNDVPLSEIVKFLKNHPEIIAINSFKQQDFLDNQKRKTKLVLKKHKI